MQWLIWIFWFAVFVAFYTYAGYGITIVLLNSIIRLFKKEKTVENFELPGISIIIPAYNEKGILAEKIKNTLLFHYPAHKMQIILVTDGSTDGSATPEDSWEQVLHIHEDARKGKTAAINRAIPFATEEIIVITDANTMINADALKKLVRHFSNPQIGGVSGEKRVIKDAKNSSAGNESLYWKYESFLKKQSASFYTIVGAAGEFFAFRKSLFIPMREDTILDDFVLSMSIVKQGFRIGYESEAYAEELPSHSIQDEFVRKVRISAGVFQSLNRLRFLFNPFFNLKAWFQFISHRLLRWTAGPAFLFISFIVSGLLWNTALFYRIYFIAGNLFLLQAVTGYIFRNQKPKVPGFFIPFYFMMMNIALLSGLRNYMQGKQSVLWKKAAR